MWPGDGVSRCSHSGLDFYGTACRTVHTSSPRRSAYGKMGRENGQVSDNALVWDWLSACEKKGYYLSPVIIGLAWVAGLGKAGWSWGLSSTSLPPFTSLPFGWWGFAVGR